MVTTVNVGDSRLAYTETGTGTPVIWLHGSGPGATGMSNFGGNMPAFQDYRNIVVDLPGWGRSPRDIQEPLIFHAAEMVMGAMTALGIRKAHLVGNSYGGGVAMPIAVYDTSLATDALIDERYNASLAVHPELPVPPDFGDITPDLPGIKAPTLLVWGREDQTVPLTWAPRILNGITDAELRVLPNCRHWVQYEKALEFDHIVREFLAGGVAAAASGE
jgi:4,5:9,10-diseco-3-hydroxy-5,9,17-trioxoandrosta-1(10),2-diene-4-oate hydrolase